MEENLNDDTGTGKSTAGTDYADRLLKLDNSRWRRVLGVQAPYRWNIRRLHLGWTLDVGCGLGRNLAHLEGHGVGVDHNADAIAVARARGLKAYTDDEFPEIEYARAEAFDSLLLSHLVEHLSESFARELVGSYLGYLKPGGTVCFITPQEVGYRSDATHVTFVDFDGLSALSNDLGLIEKRHYSFPFPRSAGKAFRYNEFVLLSEKKGK